VRLATLFYIHDPMCSWCWGFAPTLKKLIASLPDDIVVRRVLGGLAKDTDAPMPEAMQTMLQNTWRNIEEKIPGTHFNFDFWTQCQPRRSTYPSCRAVIAARAQGTQFDELMTHAIQTAYYQQARNPSDNDTLVDLANELGLDKDRFKEDLLSAETQQQLETEIELSRELYAESFPSLVLQRGESTWRISVDYNDVTPMRNSIIDLCEG